MARQDRSEIRVELLPEKVSPGRSEGYVELDTSDPEFSSLKIPVTLVVE